MAKTMTFMMGLPAAGKSTVAAERFASTHTFIDPDAIKQTHPDYNPEEAFRIHEWSMVEAEKQFMEALFNGEGNFLIDGTGCNAESMVRRMNMAKAWGFTVELVYVKVALATSLKRAAARERKVPEDVIRAKALSVSTAFELISPYADSIEVINND